MFDIRYHVATLVAIFIALGVGILIGSTLVGGDVMVEQQKKIISQLEAQFDDLRERESQMAQENAFMSNVSRNYEEFSRTFSVPLIKNRLNGYRVAIIVTGGQEIPAGMLNSLSLAGARVDSTTVVLPGIRLNDSGLLIRVCDYYQLDHSTPPDELRKMIALSAAGIVANGGDSEARTFLEDNNLVNFDGDYGGILDEVILIGGARDENLNYPASVDAWFIRSLQNYNKNILGCETSRVPISYMTTYQEFDISTIDDIDMTPGQIAMVRVLEGETGDYGVKSTAKKFMPSLPAEYLRGDFQ
ncbi:MAG: copper transporter [Syntrophomonadales bacterium]|jgi:hypothetical protein